MVKLYHTAALFKRHQPSDFIRHPAQLFADALGLPLTLILSATLYFLPSPTLFQILHLLFGIGLLQFIGGLIDPAANK